MKETQGKNTKSKWKSVWLPVTREQIMVISEKHSTNRWRKNLWLR